MQFAVLLTFVAAAMAASIPKDSGSAKRQDATQPTVQNAAMTTEDGSIVAFDAANVYLDSVAKGL